MGFTDEVLPRPLHPKGRPHHRWLLSLTPLIEHAGAPHLHLLPAFDSKLSLLLLGDIKWDLTEHLLMALGWNTVTQMATLTA